MYGAKEGAYRVNRWAPFEVVVRPASAAYRTKNVLQNRYSH